MANYDDDELRDGGPADQFDDAGGPVDGDAPVPAADDAGAAQAADRAPSAAGGAPPPPAAAGKSNVDANGGFYDEQGLYHDGMGGVYDADGNYYYDDAQAAAAGGQFYDEENPDLPDAGYNKGDQGCCKMFMTSVYPLMITIIVFNVIMIILGGTILGTGVYVLDGGQVQLQGFSNIEGVVTSSPFVFSIICIVLGALIILFTTLGIAISKFMATGGMYGFIRCVYFIYQSFLILTLLILMAICILSGVGLGLTKGNNGFSENGWGDTVVLSPGFACNQEYRFLCAGYKNYDCVQAGTDASGNCPGVRCINFCRVDDPIRDNRSLCSGCVNDKVNDNYDFALCTDFESRFAYNGCQEELNKSLENTYTLVVIVTSIAAFFTILTIVAASWKSCSCCQ